MFNSHFKIPPISQDCNLRQTTQNNINNIINLGLNDYLCYYYT